jgi:uncharacterized membrane protein
MVDRRGAPMTAVALRTAFIAASIVWAVLLVAVPFAVSQPHVTPMVAVLVAGVYSIGSVVCHQLPERSYYLWAAQMPVCARCAGIYFGAVLGAIASTVRTARVAAGSFNPAWTPRVALAVAVAPTALTLVYEWTTGDRPSHEIRAAAGIPIGVVVAWLVVAATENQVN